MTHRRSKAMLLCAACLFGAAAGLQPQQARAQDPVLITGAAKVVTKAGSVVVDLGQATTRPAPQQERNARARAVRVRNNKFLRSRVPALQKLHSLRQWQAANAREQQQGKRRSR